MVNLVKAPSMREAIKYVTETVKSCSGRNVLVFCEDDMCTAMENAVLRELGGFFDEIVFSLRTFLNSFASEEKKVLNAQESEMVLSRIIEENRDNLTCFKSSKTAADIYGTISYLYGMDADMKALKDVGTQNSLLKRKMGDIGILYDKYFAYLEKENLHDSNTCLALLPEAVKSGGIALEDMDVIFAGFGSFSVSQAKAVSFFMNSAKNTHGVFVEREGAAFAGMAGGVFSECAKSGGKELSVKTLSCDMPQEAAAIRERLFNAETQKNDAVKSRNVHLFKASDEEEEYEYIAAKTWEIVLSGKGVRFKDISILVPDLKDAKRSLSRVFERFSLPYYVDGSYPLSSSPVCSYVLGLFECGIGGYYPDDADALISNPLFALWDKHYGDKSTGDEKFNKTIEETEREYKDECRNYILYVADFRGGVLEIPDEKTCKDYGFKYKPVSTVLKRISYLTGMIPDEGTGEEYEKAIRQILEKSDARGRLGKIADNVAARRPAKSKLMKKSFAFCLDALSSVATRYKGTKITSRDFYDALKKIFLSENVRVESELDDAVEVRDVSRTMNPGTKYVFAAGMTNAVPYVGDLGVLFTEAETKELSKISSSGNGEFSCAPGLFDVNKRYSETVAQNLSSFSGELFISYPVRIEGKDDSVPSDAVSYLQNMFCAEKGSPLLAADMKSECVDRTFLSCLCLDTESAMRRALEESGSEKAFAVGAAVRRYLSDLGYAEDVEKAGRDELKPESVTCGESLFVKGGAVSPTELETWFACPYRCFVERGLGVSPRRTSANFALDVGTLMHKVLQNVISADTVVSPDRVDVIAESARNECESFLKDPPFSAMFSRKNGEYAKEMLIREVVNVCVGAFRQLLRSSFCVTETENNKHELDLGDGVLVKGVIDRVDVANDLDTVYTRVIDYKTGSTDTSAESYYMGLKLQPELYLSAVKGDTVPAGAYYFQAKASSVDTEYYTETPSLSGFTDSDERVLELSDDCFSEGTNGKKSYINGMTSGKLTDKTMTSINFAYFLEYGKAVAKEGALEMTKNGFIYPTPAKNVSSQYSRCDTCPYFSFCGYDETKYGAERSVGKLDCEDIASVLKPEKKEKCRDDTKEEEV